MTALSIFISSRTLFVDFQNWELYHLSLERRERVLAFHLEIEHDISVYAYFQLLLANMDRLSHVLEQHLQKMESNVTQEALEWGRKFQLIFLGNSCFVLAFLAYKCCPKCLVLTGRFGKEGENSCLQDMYAVNAPVLYAVSYLSVYSTEQDSDSGDWYTGFSLTEVDWI